MPAAQLTAKAAKKASHSRQAEMPEKSAVATMRKIKQRDRDDEDELRQRVAARVAEKLRPGERRADADQPEDRQHDGEDFSHDAPDDLPIVTPASAEECWPADARPARRQPGFDPLVVR